MMAKKAVSNENKKKLRIVTSSDSFAYVEAYKVLRTNLIYAADAMGEQCKVLLITSSIPSEGKSNVSVNLSITLAQAGKRVILLDCDLRKGTLRHYLRSSRQLSGLSDVLQGEASLQESIHRYRDLRIDVLFAGASPDNPSELIGSLRMGKVLRVLSDQYDYVLCDTPPIGVVSDALALGRYADGAIMVVSFDHVLRQTALSTMEQLTNSNIPVLGSILNMYDAKEARSTGNGSYGYYDYYSYGRHDDYGYGGYAPKSSSGERSKRKTSGRSGSVSGGHAVHPANGSGDDSSGRTSGAKPPSGTDARSSGVFRTRQAGTSGSRSSSDSFGSKSAGGSTRQAPAK